MALKLSHSISTGSSKGRKTSFMSLFNQMDSWVASVAALYSAFVLDKTTVGCFLLHHETAAEPVDKM